MAAFSPADLAPRRRAPTEVLLVEDDEGDAFLVRDGLSDAAPEMQVRTVGTLAEALSMAGQSAACVLLDLGLPDASGLETVARLRAGAPEVAIVVLTGQADEQLGIEAVGAGAQDYLVKGQVEPELLARAIRYAIERRRAEVSEQELLEARLQAQENTRLERGLLPQALIRDSTLSFTSDYRPGRRRALLGGDFYDAVELDDGTAHLIIGDVCGHGADEAALGASLRIAWRALTLARTPAANVLATLHEMLPHERHDADLFATVCTLEIQPDRTRACLRSAGHPPPILLQSEEVSFLEAEAASPPLGLFEQRDWAGDLVELAAPWAVLLFTDGLIEGRVNGGVERLGEERMADMVRAHVESSPGWRADAEGLLATLLTEVERLNGEPLVDDVALVLVSSTR